MAERIGIVTDSTADLPAEIVKRYAIEVIPLNVHFGEEVLKDGEEIWAEEFYHRLENGGTLANTSQPSPAEFAKIYEDLGSRCDRILSIHISEKLSGTMSSATLAAEMVRDRVEVTVVDSLVVSMGLGLIAMAAARMAAEGRGFDEIMAEVERYRREMRIFFTVETLAYLNRTGRIGKAAALMGSLLNIRPILSLNDGLIVPVEKFRGSATKANQRLLELAGKAMGDNPCVVSVVHANAASEADRLVKMLPEYVRAKEVHVSMIGPIVGAHAGPGTIGVMAVPEA